MRDLDYFSGIILALIYFVPLFLVTPKEPGDAFVAIFFLITLYPTAALVSTIVAWWFLDLDFIPWGILLLISIPVLALGCFLIWGASVPIMACIIPSIVAFFIGATQL